MLLLGPLDEAEKPFYGEVDDLPVEFLVACGLSSQGVAVFAGLSGFTLDLRGSGFEVLWFSRFIPARWTA